MDSQLVEVFSELAKNQSYEEIFSAVEKELMSDLSVPNTTQLVNQAVNQAINVQENDLEEVHSAIKAIRRPRKDRQHPYIRNGRNGSIPNGPIRNGPVDVPQDGSDGDLRRSTEMGRMRSTEMSLCLLAAYHASKCQSTSCGFGPCPEVKTTLDHMSTCFRQLTCDEEKCRKTREAICHWESCLLNRHCNICRALNDVCGRFPNFLPQFYLYFPVDDTRPPPPPYPDHPPPPPYQMTTTTPEPPIDLYTLLEEFTQANS